MTPAKSTWYCLCCEQVTPKRVSILTGHGVYCLKEDCVKAALESRFSEKYRRSEVEVPRGCPRCGDPVKIKESAMSKRLKKTMPSVVRQKSAEELKHDAQHGSDPTVTESLCTKILSGKEKYPVGSVLAKDMKYDELYSNMEREVKMCRLVSLSPKDVRISFYSGHHYLWVECSVPLLYPLSTDLSGIAREYKPKQDTKEAIMAKSQRKHGTAAKAARVAKEVNPKTGFKEGSVGDRVGTAFLSVSTPEKQLEKVMEVIAESFKAKGKSTAKDGVERQSKSWISYLHKDFTKTYGEAPAREKKAEAPKAKPKKKDKDKVAA